MGAEALLLLVKNAGALAGGVKAIAVALGVGGPNPPKFADGTPLTAEMVDAAFTAAAAPFQRIADRADAELRKLQPPTPGATP